MRKVLHLSVAMALLGVIVSAQSRSASPATLQGVWRVVEVRTTGPNASTNSSPQPGLYIFTAKHYSFLRVTADKPRPDQPQDPEKANSAELMAAWGPFFANSGTYELSDRTLTIRPLVAQNPRAMRSGSSPTFSYKIEGDTLWLTDESGIRGPIANPTTVKLARAE